MARVVTRDVTRDVRRRATTHATGSARKTRWEVPRIVVARGASLTRDVARVVTTDVTKDVTKDVTRGVTMDVTRNATRDVTRIVTRGCRRRDGKNDKRRDEKRRDKRRDARGDDARERRPRPSVCFLPVSNSLRDSLRVAYAALEKPYAPRTWILTSYAQLTQRLPMTCFSAESAPVFSAPPALLLAAALPPKNSRL